MSSVSADLLIGNVMYVAEVLRYDSLVYLLFVVPVCHV